MNWALKLQGRRRNLSFLGQRLALVHKMSDGSTVAKLITTPIFAGYYNLY